MKKRILEHLDFYTVSVLILCIVGFVLRFTNVGFLTLWFDEYAPVNRARLYPEQPLFASDNSGFLYIALIYPLFKLFGTTELMARLPSVIIGTMSIPLLYQFGKKFFNKHVGLFAALLLTFSQYHIFWSRIARHYILFLFAFLLLAYWVGKCLNVKDEFKQTGVKFFDYLHFNWQTGLITVTVLLFSVLAHQLTFLIVYAVGFYCLIVFIANLFQKQTRSYLSIYAIVGYLFVLYSVVLFVPTFQEWARLWLQLFMPKGAAEHFVPNMTLLIELWKTNPWDVFNIHFGVLKMDYVKLYVVGLIGCVWEIYRFGKSGLYGFSLFAIIFLLMCFVFRDPSVPRYLLYIYPFFLLGIAIAFYEFIFWFNRYVKNKMAQNVALAACMVAIALLSPLKRSWAMVQSKEHGRVIAQQLSHWYFPDWKSTLRRVKPMLKASDLIMSTTFQHPSFYLNKKDVFWFRQRHYDVGVHAFVNNEPDTTKQNASSLEAVTKLYNEYERGWLFGDYYLTNVMTDPRARDFIIRNADFMYALSNEYVKVFHWDKSQRKRYTNGMAELLTQSTSATFEYSMDLPNLAGKKVEIVVETEGVRYDNELLVQLNGTNLGVLLKTARTPNLGGKQTFAVEVPSNALKVGENKIRFVYNTNEYRYNKSAKVAVYNLSLQWR